MATDKPPDEPKPLVIGYVVYYEGEPAVEYQRQIKLVRRAQPKFVVEERDRLHSPLQEVRGYRRTASRPILQLLMRGLFPGDIVVVASLDRLGVTPTDMTDALLMLRANEIRVMDMDPDGEYEWRPVVERTLAALVRSRRIHRKRVRQTKRMFRDTTFRGVGWKQQGFGRPFEPCEGTREVCRTIVRLRDGGMEFEAIAGHLNAQGLMYVGLDRSQTAAFTAELAEECYLSAQQDFPYPTRITRA